MLLPVPGAQKIAGALEIRGPIRQDDGFDIYEAATRDDVYSCIALCRKNWRNDWPALGGTRVIQAGEEGQALARETAVQLAAAMTKKNNMLRNAELSLSSQRPRQIFGWQGGKGVILVPPGRHLTPQRLLYHGLLIEHLCGQYVGSKDAGVGTVELKWMSLSTGYTIGLGCLRDTGEATAHGVCSGLETAVKHFAPRCGSTSLEGVEVLVCGAGKVGYPLTGQLYSAGARVRVYDPALQPTRESVLRWCEIYDDPGASEEDRDLRKGALLDLLRKGRILSSELAALSAPDTEIISPNGGPVRWLSGRLASGLSRAEILARNGSDHQRLRLILGAGNEQVSSTRADERDDVLSALTHAGIVFIPDQVVSPGGVIAVSHELTSKWDAENVNRDAREIVRAGLHRVLSEAEQDGELTNKGIYRAFVNIAEGG
jgi:glutamate dehydrogenase/leucine dehydrogenase